MNERIGTQAYALLALVLLFAFNLGAHYTGATVGMPYASRSISLRSALAIVAIFALVGATLASGGVERPVGLQLISDRHVGATTAIVIVACANALTA
jgi:PiT family inorganic phosphate transporter